MARAKFVKKAQKADPAFGIEKGDSYYWWKFRYGGIRKSKTRPKQSQLTQSEFLSAYYGFQETIDDMEAEDTEDLKTQLEELAGEMHELADEQESRRDNMPEALQDSETGTLLEERAEGMNGWADEIESMDFDFEFDGNRYCCAGNVQSEQALHDPCGWAGNDPKEGKCPDCDGPVEENEEYESALQDRIQELIGEVQSADPGLS